MSDAELRSLERRWRERGAPADGRRYLAALERAGGPEAERLRLRLALGDVSESRLELAAFAGHGPALTALGSEPAGAGAEFPRGWLTELQRRYGQAVTVRAVVGVARRVLAERGASAMARVEAALRAAEDWADCPCAEHGRAAEAFNAEHGKIAPWAWDAVSAAHCRGHDHERSVVVAAVGLIGEDAVKKALRETLAAWALESATVYPELQGLVARGELEARRLRELRAAHDRLLASRGDVWWAEADDCPAVVWGSPLGLLLHAFVPARTERARARLARLLELVGGEVAGEVDPLDAYRQVLSAYRARRERGEGASYLRWLVKEVIPVAVGGG